LTTFSYNGINYSNTLIVNRITGRETLSPRYRLTKVPGRDGGLVSGGEVPSRVITVESTVDLTDINESPTEYSATILSNIAYNPNAVIEFSDEPDVYYYATLSNYEVTEEGPRHMRLEVSFLCYDPYAYGTQQTQELSGITAITNNGTAETYPIFDLTVNQDTSIIELTNLSSLTKAGTARSIILGQAKPIDQAPVYTSTLVLQDTMSSLTSWTGASDVDSGYVSGSFGVLPDGFYVDKWGDEDGTGVNGNSWIGPSLQKAISTPLNSFQADIYIENWNDDGGGTQVSKEAVGIIEVYMRDANGQMVCKIAFGDSFDNAYQNKGVFATAGKRYRAEHDQYGGWNDFDGILRIKRDTDYYYPYIAQITDGKHTGRERMGRIIPGPGIGTNAVTDIQIAMRKWYGARPMYQRIKEIKIYDFVGMYEYPDTTAEVKFKTGDNLHIDVAKGLVLLNGEIRTDVVGLDTDFWSLVEGLNQLVVSPYVSGTATHRNRYL